MFHILLTVLSFLLSGASAQSPSPTCPIGYFCASGSAGPQGTTQLTYGPATSTYSGQVAPYSPTTTTGFVPGSSTLPQAENIVRVDDTDPRIEYSPPLLWKAATVGGCPICVGNPPEAQTFNKTWHEGIRTMPEPGDGPLTVTFNFTGMSVSIHAILPSTQLSSNTEYITSIAILIDGEATPSGNFTWNPPPFRLVNGNVDLQWFQQQIYTSFPLPQGEHSVQLIGAAGGWSMFLLDYVEYHAEDLSLSGTQSSGPATVTPSANAGASANRTSSPVQGSDAIPVSTQSSSDASPKRIYDHSLYLFWVLCGAGAVLFSGI